MSSILKSTKQILGISPDDDSFDADIIIFINTAFSILTQMGIGPAEGFKILDADAEWSDYTNDDSKVSMVESYIPLKVRLLFDPPTSTPVMECLNRMISELEWRLQTEFEIKNIDKEEIQNE